MSDRQHNPFQNADIIVPSEFRDEILRYMADARTSMDQAPFSRQVDIWFLAMCVAVRLGLPPVDLAGRNTYKMITGTVFSTDPWRIQALTLIAMARTDDIKIAADSSKIMSIACSLAAAGLPRVFEMLRDGDGDPLWNFSDSLEELIREVA